MVPFPWDVVEPGVEGHVLTHKSMMHDIRLMADERHLNALGLGVFAERVARSLVDWGLGEYADSYEEMSQELPAIFSSAEQAMKAVEDKGLDLAKMREKYDLAQPLEEGGFLYTAKWDLEEEIIAVLDRVLSEWDYVTESLNTLNATILKAREQGVDERLISPVEGYCLNAEKYWAKLDAENTMKMLEMAFAGAEKIPEPILLSILGIILLSTLLSLGRKG